MIRLADIQQKVNELWAAPHVPLVALQGQGLRLTHPFGYSVDFDITRADLALPASEFATNIIQPAIDELRKVMPAS